jgi:hypothetical protein
MATTEPNEESSETIPKLLASKAQRAPAITATALLTLEQQPPG